MSEALYLHVPFCNAICYYCDFKRSVYDSATVEAWLLKIESDLKKNKINPQLKTIYIGGGTPTSLSFQQLEKLLKLLAPYTDDLEEYTIESNLESIDEQKLMLLKNYKVNRISLGVQSYDDDLLKYMNRKHHANQIDSKIDEISKYIKNISIDLIYGFENQTLVDWQQTLQQAVSNGKIKHISIYSLTIEDNSVFGKRGIEQIDNELEANMYEQAITLLEGNGLKQYEVANFAKQHYESKHNQYYWHYQDFYGIGVGASGKQDHLRYSIEGSVADYLNNQEQITKEHLQLKDEMFEFIMMNLRLKKGLDIACFDDTFNLSFSNLFDQLLKQLMESEYIEYSEESVKTTKKGLFYLHDILIQFMEVLDERKNIE